MAAAAADRGKIRARGRLALAPVPAPFPGARGVRGSGTTRRQPNCRQLWEAPPSQDQTLAQAAWEVRLRLWIEWRLGGGGARAVVGGPIGGGHAFCGGHGGHTHQNKEGSLVAAGEPQGGREVVGLQPAWTHAPASQGGDIISSVTMRACALACGGEHCACPCVKLTQRRHMTAVQWRPWCRSPLPLCRRPTHPGRWAPVRVRGKGGIDAVALTVPPPPYEHWCALVTHPLHCHRAGRTAPDTAGRAFHSKACAAARDHRRSGSRVDWAADAPRAAHRWRRRQLAMRRQR